MVVCDEGLEDMVVFVESDESSSSGQGPVSCSYGVCVLLLHNLALSLSFPGPHYFLLMCAGRVCE